MSPTHRRIPAVILIPTLLAVVLTLALAFNVSPLLRGGAGWRWPYEVPAEPARLLPGIVALVLYLSIGLIWMRLLERQRTDRPMFVNSTWKFLLYCILGGVAVQLAFLAFYGPPVLQLFLRTISIGAGGFYDVGVRFEDIPATLRNYPELMSDWTAHPRAHPPGIPLLFWGASKVFAWSPGLSNSLAAGFRAWQCHHRVLMALPDAAINAALLGMITPLLGLLSIFPLYDLSLRLYGERTARLAALWLPLIPAYVMFTPQWNQFHILFTVVGLWLAERGLSATPNRSWLGLTGLILSAATFLSFTNLNTVGIVGLFGLLLMLLVRRKAWTRTEWGLLAQGLTLAAAGFASVWLVYYAISGVTPVDLLSVSMEIHYELQEPYVPWLFFFPMDLFLFTGLVLAFLASIEEWRALKSILRGEAAAANVLVLALWLAVIILNVAGVARGEVGRLMLILMPMFVIAAAHVVSEAQEPVPSMRLATGALVMQLVVMVAFLRVIGTELAPPPVNPTNPVAMQGAFPANASFSAAPVASGLASLIGYDAALTPVGNALDLTLYWRGTDPFDHAYFISAIVVGPDGAPLGSSNWLPADGSYPTSCWKSQEVIADHTVIPLNSAPPGNYWVSVSMFDFDTRTLLPVAAPDAPPDTQVGLGPISIK